MRSVDALTLSGDQLRMRDFFRRILTKNLDYSTRYHLKARLRAVDVKFLAALIALAIAIFVVLRLY